MTLVIKKPTTSKLVTAKSYVGIDDPDAATYIAAVEAADGQALETATRVAIHSFVKGCKADGIWPAIKASCILAGARTLSGALVPLVGAGPTNFNFVSGDYNRKTGLVGNASSKYLNSNIPHGTAKLNNSHVSVYASTAYGSGVQTYIAAGVATYTYMSRDSSSPPSTWYINDSGSAVPRFTDTGTGFKGISRISSDSFTRRSGGSSTSVTRSASVTVPDSETFLLFAQPGPTGFANARLAFYSIGEALDLALLDNRVTTLVNAIGAAIP